MAGSPHSLGRSTTRDQLLSKIDARKGLWGSSKASTDGPDAKAQLIDVDFDGFLRTQKPPRTRPAYEASDNELLRAIQFNVYKRTKDLRSIFAKIASRPEGKIGRNSDKIPRFSLRQFQGQLDDWGLSTSPGQLERILAPYEDVPGEGFDYSDFSDVVNLFSADSCTVRRSNHQTQLADVAQKPVSRTTASNILQTTTASTPGGKYGTYDGVVELYGCGNGLDVNCDGTNNGFLPRDETY
eukprot:TRINITY_DN9233_c0_g1_i1.p1 TRINITY_DN9233_c0_g1~~TRINITY_DN9233_c0_g1_i1.p1  ORF type:complete len:261 (+),score=91.77 TRINITY_DN9233_c0_g1_i1:64-783(+)